MCVCRGGGGGGENNSQTWQNLFFTLTYSQRLFMVVKSFRLWIVVTSTELYTCTPVWVILISVQNHSSLSDLDQSAKSKQSEWSWSACKITAVWVILISVQNHSSLSDLDQRAKSQQSEWSWSVCKITAVWVILIRVQNHSSLSDLDKSTNHSSLSDLDQCAKSQQSEWSWSEYKITAVWVILIRVQITAALSGWSSKFSSCQVQIQCDCRVLCLNLIMKIFKVILALLVFNGDKSLNCVFLSWQKRGTLTFFLEVFETWGYSFSRVCMFTLVSVILTHFQVTEDILNVKFCPFWAFCLIIFLVMFESDCVSFLVFLFL